MNWDIVISILSGLAVCIPLVIKLVQTIANYIKEKNWSALIKLVLQFMVEAETKYKDNEQRKEFVLDMVEASAKQLNYNYDEEAKAKVSQMIDDICTAAKTINA